MHRHPFAPSYLIAGLVFVAVAVVGLVGGLGLVVADLRWLGPALLVLLGIMLVIGTATRRGDRDASPTGPQPSDRTAPAPDPRTPAAGEASRVLDPATSASSDVDAPTESTDPVAAGSSNGPTDAGSTDGPPPRPDR